MPIDHIEREVRDLKKTVAFELKDIYKSIANFKVSIGILMDTVEKLNEYTHTRIHKLTNTDQGIEMVLVQIKERFTAIEKALKAFDDLSNSVKKRCIDFFFKIISTTALIFIGMIIKSHWFKL